MSKYQLKNSSIYVDGTDIPKNKLNVTDSQLLHEIENSLLEEAYQVFYSSLTSDTILDETYFISLHQNTFESLYDWAGIYRNTNMSKGESQFCLASYLSESSQNIFDKLASENY
jgi:cell filamentation protein